MTDFQRLKEYLKQHGYNQTDAAKLLGMSTQTVNNILRGQDKLSLNFLKKLLKHFPNMNIDYILLGRGEPDIIVNNITKEDIINIVAEKMAEYGVKPKETKQATAPKSKA
jgi:transcriptional regulator with XRE-family HTH domain